MKAVVRMFVSHSTQQYKQTDRQCKSCINDIITNDSVFFYIFFDCHLQGAVYYDTMNTNSILKKQVTWVYIQVTIDT